MPDDDGGIVPGRLGSPREPARATSRASPARCRPRGSAPAPVQAVPVPAPPRTGVPESGSRGRPASSRRRYGGEGARVAGRCRVSPLSTFPGARLRAGPHRRPRRCPGLARPRAGFLLGPVAGVRRLRNTERISSRDRVRRGPQESRCELDGRHKAADPGGGRVAPRHDRVPALNRLGPLLRRSRNRRRTTTRAESPTGSPPTPKGVAQHCARIGGAEGRHQKQQKGQCSSPPGRRHRVREFHAQSLIGGMSDRQAAPDHHGR